MSTASPGWYVQADGTERFWSGAEWTEHQRHPPAHQGLVAVRPVPPQPSYQTGGHAGVVYSPTVAPKSPGLALLASFFVPGLGQLINGDAAKGVLMFLGYVFSFALMLVLIGFLSAPAIWIWSMVDAYTGAQRWNLQRGIIS